jgi:hypothetical protein
LTAAKPGIVGDGNLGKLIESAQGLLASFDKTTPTTALERLSAKGIESSKLAARSALPKETVSLIRTFAQSTAKLPPSPQTRLADAMVALLTDKIASSPPPLPPLPPPPPLPAADQSREKSAAIEKSRASDSRAVIERPAVRELATALTDQARRFPATVDTRLAAALALLLSNLDPYLGSERAARTAVEQAASVQPDRALLERRIRQGLRSRTPHTRQLATALARYLDVSEEDAELEKSLDAQPLQAIGKMDEKGSARGAEEDIWLRLLSTMMALLTSFLSRLGSVPPEAKLLLAVALTRILSEGEAR